jgi:hypothetical protein
MYILDQVMKIDQKIGFSITLVIDLKKSDGLHERLGAPSRAALQQVILLMHTPLQGAACAMSRSPPTGRRCSPLCVTGNQGVLTWKHCRAKAFADGFPLGTSAARTTVVCGVTRSGKGVRPLNGVQASWTGISDSKSGRE